MLQPRTIRAAFALFVSAWLLSPFAHAKEPWERPWIELRTPHFVIYSGLAEQRSVDLAVELEEFRTVVDLMTGGGGVEEPIPTRIYILPGAMRELGIGNDTVGYFRAGMRANWALMMPNGRESDQVLKHEYVHYLVRNRGGNYPPWLDEGVAEVFSTLEVTDRAINYGKPPNIRVDWLTSRDWISFTDVLNARETASFGPEMRAMFYAQSWLLMQYLMVGRDGANLRAELREFMRRSEAGDAPNDAFTATWGIEVARLDRELVSYTRSFRILTAALETPFPRANVATRLMRPSEAAAQLGLLALLNGSYDDAREFYEAARRLEPDNTIALVGIADLHKFAGRFDEARPLYERAIALEPDNAEHELDYAEFFSDRAENESDVDRRRALLVEARRHFARSHQLNPANPETLFQNGTTYLYVGEEIAKGVASLEAAYELLPSHERIQFELARSYIVIGETELARQLLQRLLVGVHSSRVDDVRRLLEYIDSPQSAAP